jgi:hypothetical protein
LIEDFKNGCLKPFYQSDGFCSMEKLPFPRLDLLRKDAYMTVNCVQTTRGCPHQCDFCHVTHFFGTIFNGNDFAINASTSPPAASGNISKYFNATNTSALDGRSSMSAIPILCL